MNETNNLESTSGNKLSQNRGSLTKAKQKVKYDLKPEPTSQIPAEEIEPRKLAQQIGIDYDSEKEKYSWFLSQVK